MLSFICSRPWRELASPAARICPSGEPARSSLSLLLSSCLACTQRHTCPSKCGGLILPVRSVHSRSTTMATASTEQRIIGSIIQPPDLINSHTSKLQQKICHTLAQQRSQSDRISSQLSAIKQSSTPNAKTHAGSPSARALHGCPARF